MDSWWGLGESLGYRGETLALHRITCPFCMERGNFSRAFHVEKKKPNSKKKLNCDTLLCRSCAGFVMVLWSSSEYAYGDNALHDFRVLPYPLKFEEFPEHWPKDVGRYWLQAKRNLVDENWDAAAMMARSSLQLALRAHGAEGRTFKDEVDDSPTKGSSRRS